MTGNDYIGRTIGRYELLEEIGRGGMATVYRAMDTNLAREVALKLLHPHLASHGESRTRFQREAQAVARLKHDSVLEIYDYSGDEGDDVFIAMELVQGTTLRKFLENRKGDAVAAEATALIFQQVCGALAHAHAHGVIHRDVKPENILIGPKGEVKLSDFGIAHMAGMSQMTVTGQILGSPAYMSPEHVEMTDLDARADVFSVGIILYEASVGRQPFEGKNPHAVLKKIVEGEYTNPLSVNPGIGHDLAAIVRQCLKKDRSERFNKVDDLLIEIDTLIGKMGLGDPKEALCEFFKDPDGWFESRSAQIIDTTMALGLEAKRKKRQSEAMNHFNRVLALEPGNEKALSVVAGMHRSKQLRFWLERVALVAAIVLIVGGAVWAFARGEKSPTAVAERPIEVETEKTIEKKPTDQAPPIVAPIPKVEDTETAKEEAVPEPQSAALPVKRRPKPQNNSTAEEPQLRKVVFTPQPLAVEVVIDGKTRFPFGPANRSSMVSVGDHSFSFIPKDKTRFVEQTWKVRIDEGTAPYHFRGRLLWRPAELLVNSNVDAVVTVPGRATDKANKAFAVDIKKGPSERVSVLVSREGYIPQTKQVTINAGELAKTRVDLQKAPDSK